ncbi:MAG: PEP-CTERM sorting domain-containing protein [Acidobacteria bacterium]|nr:PEP-CTERM sorting domain-containing protein [Acidobacteriota bacterium]
MTLRTLWTLMMLTTAMAQGNVINDCTQVGFTGGSMNSCVFAHNPTLLTGTLSVTETMTAVNPASINISLGLTNTIAGNNVPGIFDYAVTKVIVNNSGVTWYGFDAIMVAASGVSSPVGVLGFSSCNTSGLTVHCSGGTVANGGVVVITFHTTTPADQSAGAFGMIEIASTPEPATMSMAGLGLIAAGLMRRHRNR